MNRPPAVLLWWNSALRLLTPEGKVVAQTVAADGDHLIEIERMMATACPDATSLRLIDHPSHLDFQVTACPDAGRSQLRAVFAHDFPALTLPDTVWSVEPVKRHGDGTACSTILYLDRRSRLPQLIAALRRSGISVEGIWPLQTLIEATPPCAAAREGFLSVLVIGQHSLVSSVRPAGGRSLRIQEQAAAKLEADAYAAYFDGRALPPGLLVLDDGTANSHPHKFLRDLPFTATPLADFLGRARQLTPGGISDFSPREPLARLNSFAPFVTGAVGLACLLWAAQVSFTSHRAAARARQRTESSIAEQTQLTELISSRRALKDRIETLNRDLERMEASPQAHADFLTAVTAALPRTMQLKSLTIKAGSFQLSGSVFEGGGTPTSPTLAFRQTLAVQENLWQLAEPAPELADGRFSLHGSFVTRP